MLNKILGYLSSDIAMDLGTANTLIYVENKGLVLNEPSVVAVEKHYNRNRIVAVGKDAKMMLGRTPDSVTAIRPLCDGVIYEFDVAEVMIKFFIDKATQSHIFERPRVIVCIPSGANSVERRAIEDAVLSAGASKVYLIEEPMAAAIGADLPVEKPTASMIVDIGGGTTEVAIISLNGLVRAKSIKVAGDSMDFAITDFLYREHNMLIGTQMAESIKINIGSAIIPDKPEKEMLIRGRDLKTSIPKEITVNDKQIAESLCETISEIISATKTVLEKAPAELASDIVDRGMVLTGGGALLKDLDEVLRRSTNLPVHIANNPLLCVVLGASKALKNLRKFDYLRKFFMPKNISQ